VWHKIDRRFNTPRAALFLRLSSPLWSSSPATAALTHLLLKMAEDCLAEEAYLADVAGLHYDMSPEGMAGGVWVLCVGRREGGW
jgi:nardilysin